MCWKRPWEPIDVSKVAKDAIFRDFFLFLRSKFVQGFRGPVKKDALFLYIMSQNLCKGICDKKPINTGDFGILKSEYKYSYFNNYSDYIYLAENLNCYKV